MNFADALLVSDAFMGVCLAIIVLIGIAEAIALIIRRRK